MKSLFKLSVTALTLLSFSFFSVVPATARESLVSQSRLQKRLDLINQAIAAYEARGTQAFVDAMGSNMEKKDADSFKRLIKGHPAFPKISATSENRFVVKSDSTVVSFEIVNAEEGSMLINGKPFHYDTRAGLEHNALAIRDLLVGANGKKVSLMDYLIPQAHAFELSGLSVILIGVAAALLAGGLFNPKMRSWFGNGKEHAAKVEVEEIEESYAVKGGK